LIKKGTKKNKAVPYFDKLSNREPTILLGRYGGNEKNSPYSTVQANAFELRIGSTLFLVVELVETLPPPLPQNRDFVKAGLGFRLSHI
jgi:hypothetical protein